MGNDIQKGTIYSEGGVGGAGTVNAGNLNAHVDEARIKATFISEKSLRDPATLSDSIVVEAGGVLYRETFQQIIDLIGQTIQIPVGAVIDFAGASPPGGWLMCFGQTVLRDTYPELFDVIGVTYGSTDSTNFLLPDLRGRVAAGKDDMGGTPAGRLTIAYLASGGGPTALGGHGGLETQTMNVTQMPAHSHNTTSIVYRNIGPTVTGYHAYPTAGGTFDPSNVSATIGSGGGQPHPNVQPTVIVNKIIRYQ